MTSDLYEILGVRGDASQTEIRIAFRIAAKRLHPDRTGDSASAREFIALQLAYETLRDPKKRAEYDKNRSSGPVRSRTAPPRTRTSRAGSARTGARFEQRRKSESHGKPTSMFDWLLFVPKMLATVLGWWIAFSFGISLAVWIAYLIVRMLFT